MECKANVDYVSEMLDYNSLSSVDYTSFYLTLIVLNATGTKDMHRVSYDPFIMLFTVNIL